MGYLWTSSSRMLAPFDEVRSMLLGLRSYLKTTVVGPLLGGLLTAAAGALASAPAAAVELQPFTLATPFPANFLYGTAVAGFQVEMGCPTTAPEVCEDRHSDWYAFITSPWTLFDPLLHLTTDAPSAGPGFYESYPSDLRLAKDALASNAVRVSVEWSRIFPTPTFGVNGYEALKAQASPQALAYYHAQFAAIRALGMEPFVTLNHYTLPTWIHDAVGCHYSLLLCSPKGWADPDMIVPEIAKYAGFVAHEFGPEVDYWATLNGPFASIVFAGYLFPSEIRSNPPGLLLNFPAAKIAMRAMVYAHARMVDAVRAEDRWSAKPGTAPATVGLIASNLVIEAVSGKDQDRQAADGLRYLVNDLFLTAVADGDLDEDWTRQPVHHEDLAGRLDFIGLNYYSRIQIGAAPESAEQAKAAASPLVTFDLQQFAAQQQPQAPFSDFSPEALFQLIADTAKYHRPIYITETGYDAGEDSTLASNWLIQSLDATRRALAAGYDVRGYFYWSLLDNFEWNKGYKPRFGLYGVEPTDPAKKRTPRPAAALFHQFGDTRLLPAVVPATD